MTTALVSLSRLAAPSEPHSGTRIAEARRSLDHWSRHASGLPWHRRTARREARRMIATARAQLICAHLDRWGLGAVERLLGPLLDTRGRSAGSHARAVAFASMRRSAVGRRILASAAALAAVTVASAALVAGLLTHVIGF